MGYLDTFINTGIGSGVGLVSGALSSLIGGGIQSIFQNRAANQQFKQNVQLQKMANDFTVDMWNKTNDYNSPVNQLQLYQNAGINPNVAIGNMNGTPQASPVQSDSQSVSAQNPSSIFDANVTDAWNETRANEANIKLAEAQAKMAEKEASRYDEMTDAQIDQISAVIEKSKKDGKLSEEQANQISTMLPILKEQGLQGIEKMKQDIELVKSNIQEIAEAINLTKEKVNTEKSVQKANIASANESASRVGVNEATTENIKQDTKNKEVEHNKLLEEEKQVKYDAIWKALEIELFKNGVDINASSSKRTWQKVCNELVNAKDENDVKRILKKTAGGILRLTDYLLENAGSIIAGVIGGTVAGKAVSRGRINTGSSVQNPNSPLGDSGGPSLQHQLNKFNNPYQYGPGSSTGLPSN